MKTIVLALALLLTAGVASAQHGHQQHGQQHGQQHEQRGRHEEQGHGERGEHGRRGFDRDHHRRYGRNDFRERGGRREFLFGGIWFSADVYPDWFYAEDVYVIQEGDVYYVRSYVHPAYMFQVNVAF